MLPMADNGRRYPRLEINQPARAVTGNAEHQTVVRDISEGGAAIVAPHAMFANDQFLQLHMAGHEPMKGRIVRELPDGFAIEFEPLDDKKEREKREAEIAAFRNIVKSDEKY